MFGIGIIFMYIVWGGFVAIILYALYRVLSVLLNRYLTYKQDQTAAIREQNEALREIAAALKKQNNNSIPPELP
ncbi:hypothetical protein ORI89_16050 [Sphingobacterium sp. UT-1RO-CII-1]|uniref:hypothetical protein n=1 Tax=Sphingobacterium sp. UT-1RO-CII-1 TaxID=2995225 RepID=UPI00227C5B66|nr:hypothetical protein [Sphingobacterium sp. UT-1RO-CII-1]MCY4781175.1 hypothetical protein [Sphingobacterium sp. UT-1RO-CII-1]